MYLSFSKIWQSELQMRIKCDLLSSSGYSPNEIQRQNRITQRIIANFLERKLFPYRRPQHQVPTIDEILPLTTEQPRLHKQRTALDLFNKIKNYKSEERNQEDDEETEEEVEDLLAKSEDYYDDADAAADYSDSSDTNNQSISLRTGRGGGTGAYNGRNYDEYDEYPGFADSNNNYDSESLQSVESEHLDSFYRSKKHKLFHLDADFFEGRSLNSGGGVEYYHLTNIPRAFLRLSWGFVCKRTDNLNAKCLLVRACRKIG